MLQLSRRPAGRQDSGAGTLPAHSGADARSTLQLSRCPLGACHSWTGAHPIHNRQQTCEPHFDTLSREATSWKRLDHNQPSLPGMSCESDMHAPLGRLVKLGHVDALHSGGQLEQGVAAPQPLRLAPLQACSYLRQQLLACRGGRASRGVVGGMVTTGSAATAAAAGAKEAAGGH